MRQEKGRCMIFKDLAMGFVGLCGGVLVAAGLFAFIVIIGVVTRLISRTNTAKHVLTYENVIAAGATIGNVVYVFRVDLPMGIIGLILLGVFAGMFVGCLSASLAEMLKVMPAFEKRIDLIAVVHVHFLTTQSVEFSN